MQLSLVSHRADHDLQRLALLLRIDRPEEEADLEERARALLLSGEGAELQHFGGPVLQPGVDRLRHAEHVQLDEMRALRVLCAGVLLRDLAELHRRHVVCACVHEDEQVLLVVEGAVEDLGVLVER